MAPALSGAPVFRRHGFRVITPVIPRPLSASRGQGGFDDAAAVIFCAWMQKAVNVNLKCGILSRLTSYKAVS